ncbi:MAG: serine/threonine protein kinase, partial [Blastocatellia bacterium]
DAGRVRRFEQEARAASALNHPNILTIFEIGEANETHYIATEFIDGQTLRERLNGDRLSPPAALDIASRIAAALTAAHEAGIVHRDIKPENVMLRRNGIVKVLDFGLAKLIEQRPAAVDSQAPTIAKAHTDPGAVLGTVGYMSPEQVRGQEADHRADIFSFGVILYEMLSGRRAFDGESAIEVMNAILKEEAPELSETNTKISPALDKIVRRCLEKKPERRFQTASDPGFALEALSSPSGSRLETQAALFVPPGNVGASSVGKRERLAWIVAAALLLVTLGFAWAYFTRQPLTNDARAMRYSIVPPEKSSFSQISVSTAPYGPGHSTPTSSISTVSNSRSQTGVGEILSALIPSFPSQTTACWSSIRASSSGGVANTAGWIVAVRQSTCRTRQLAFPLFGYPLTKSDLSLTAMIPRQAQVTSGCMTYREVMLSASLSIRRLI